MEGLVALGVVANVVQLLDASWKAVEVYKEFRERGTTAQIDAMSYATAQLSECNHELRISLENAPNKISLLQSDVALTELTKTCEGVADELQKVLKSLQIGPAATRTGALIHAVKIKMKRRWRRLEELKFKLDQYAKVLDSKILVHLGQNMGTLSAQQTNVVDKLDELQKKLLQELVKGNTCVKGLVTAMNEMKQVNETAENQNKSEHVATRQLIDSKVDHLVQRQAERAELDNLLKSLHFPEIDQRQDSIEDAHAQTFEWIFKDSVQLNKPWLDKPWSSFLDWARNDDDQLYWILGKPGSGKSTLMNFLVQDERPKAALTSTPSDLPPLLLTFFFWDTGVPLQKNEIGLLRSLIWRILTCLDSSSVALPVWAKEKRASTVWTKKQLLPLLRMAVEAVPNRLCLFLDGLDEFRGLQNDFDAIIDILKVFRGQKGVKICISSRPSTTLKELYRDCSKLRLQDLTRGDITRYVEDSLINNSRMESLPLPSPEQIAQLVHDLVAKGQGVFLWIRLVIQSLLRGMRNGDDLRTLHDRLDQIPEGIFELYTHMWKRMEADHPFYAKEAALYLQFAREFGVRSLVEFAVAGNEELQREYLDASNSLDLEQLGKGIDLERARTRLMACCTGFLEIVDGPRIPPSYLKSHRSVLQTSAVGQYPTTVNRLVELRRSYCEVRVSFIHRTAREYLQTPAGRQLLEAKPMQPRDLRQLRSRCRLVLQLLLIVGYDPRGFHGEFRFCFDFACTETDENDDFKILLQLEEVCETIFSWGILNSLNSAKVRNKARNKWPVNPDTGKVDYVEAFLEFGNATYTKHKLVSSGLSEDPQYLTNLLRKGVHILQSEWKGGVLQTIPVLVSLGADVNASTGQDLPGNDPLYKKDATIWQQLLRNVFLRLHGTASTSLNSYKTSYIASISQVLRVFLQAGADPNASYHLVLTKGMYRTISGQTF
ncbi:hypothetical protein A1O3_02534 [Capronia epimyces CBS 606.96]|uniref:Uncharacterized protein n=1 Tax=Capronia epimyces CBS 606.96 TaxID=1182542 RepID=W9Y9F3_9EURO|nr:uncharacterized protein A1O3_02534 [Capronia epimyces CBS 606.96]EXJ89467.1 hypothetical protein A1O3_02534 [Capronia epimyces CBS 606.96]